MKSGELRNRIQFQTAPAVEDATYGEVDPAAAWTTSATVWALIHEVAAKELQVAQANYPEVTHTIRCRWKNGITAGMRVRYNNTVTGVVEIYEILGIMNVDHRNREMKIAAKTGTHTVGGPY